MWKTFLRPVGMNTNRKDRTATDDRDVENKSWKILISGRLGIVQSEVEAVLALLWREQHEKVAKKHEKLLSAPSFSKFCLSRALSALKPWDPRRCSEYTNYHHIKCNIVSLFSNNFEKDLLEKITTATVPSFRWEECGMSRTVLMAESLLARWSLSSLQSWSSRSSCLSWSMVITAFMIMIMIIMLIR